MLWESIFTNGIYYVIMFILWITKVWIPTLTGIALMFGIGMAIDFIPTLGCYLYLLKKEGIKPQFNFYKEDFDNKNIG